MVFQEQLIKSLRENGGRTAIEKGQEYVSYSDLLHTANAITRFLLNRQIEKQTLIGIRVNDRASFIYAMIGIANAGCVFVPLDPTMPDSRFEALVTELNLQYIISLGQSLPCDIGQHYLLQDILKMVDDSPVSYPAFDKNDSLYIYFTSGSTGKPKGIVGKNCSLLQFIQWEISEFQPGNNIRVSQLISPYFDACLRDIFVPLLAGGTICLPPEDDDLFSPHKIISWIDQSYINLIHCVPSVFRAINSSDILTANHFPALQYVLLSGERIIPSELTNWYQLFDERIQLVNLYGATETTMVRTFYRIKPADIRQARIPVGMPISATEILIAKNDFKPCDPLLPGDVYIITDYASKGYLNDPELTHEKFLKLRDKTGFEKTAFKTGDVARKLVNGQIDLMGREDRQVKVAGIRIEPGEIESVLIESGYVSNALVVHHSQGGNDSLVAFVIKKDGHLENVDVEMAVRLYAKSRLPQYMLPAVIRETKAFPLLSNGKINYKQLIATLETRVIVPPVNDTELRLLGIWHQVLGDKAISTEDPFHKAGGNSLAIMKLIGLIYKEFNMRLSLQDLFNNMTIKKQAELVIKAENIIRST